MNSTGSLSRRVFLKDLLRASGALAVSAASVGIFATAPSEAGKGSAAGPKVADGEWEARLDAFARNIKSGGPPKDGIPPIDNPQYTSAEEAEQWLAEDAVVFGVDYNGVVKAYPQIILVWHEIVNEQMGGEKVTITYCPLTGSAVGFKGRSGIDGAELIFGTSGKLVNSNLLMYDRQTDGEWPQILGMAINGPNKGRVLQEFPVIWTTWGRWKAQYPQTTVLSQDTGFFRAYGRDPYGSYAQRGTYYDSGGPFFPVMAEDRRFPAKKVMIGVKHDQAALAIPKEEFRATRVGHARLGGVPIVALYDELLDTVRVYGRRVGGQELTFRWQAGGIVDVDTHSRWTPHGEAVEGPLAKVRLPPINVYDVMWFAWYAFYPHTQVGIGDG